MKQASSILDQDIKALRAFLNFYPRRDVARLYNVARLVWRYSDAGDRDELTDLATHWQRLSDAPMRDLEIKPADQINVQAAKTIARLKIIYGFDASWVDAFLLTSIMGTQPVVYKSVAESMAHLYGAGEALGLMLAAVLRLPKEAQSAVQAQAKAICWLHYLNDIPASTAKGQLLFPRQDLKKAGLKKLDKETAQANPKEFTAFMHAELRRYHQWQHEARELPQFISRRQRVALHTAIDSYAHTARRLYKQPLTIYDKKVTPSRRRLLLGAIAHSFD
jgi:phytoene/squalene synthetase